MSENLDWNANIEDLEQDEVQEWEFNHRPANDKGKAILSNLVLTLHWEEWLMS